MHFRRLSLSFAFFLVTSAPALARETIVEVGKYEIRIDETDPPAVPELRIRVNHFRDFEDPDYRGWKITRMFAHGDRLGERAYWLTADGSGSLAESAARSYPAEWAADELDIRLSVSPKKKEEIAREWRKLRFFQSPKTRYAALPYIQDFFKRHEADFGKLIDRYSPPEPSWQPGTFRTVNEVVWELDLFRTSLGHEYGAPSFEKQREFVQKVRSGSYAGPMRKARYQTDLPPGAPLFVTHASNAYDTRETIKPALDRLIRAAKSEHRPVIFLVHDDVIQDFTWFTEDRRADRILFSGGGEHSFFLSNPDPIHTGGFLDQCLRRSVQDSITRFFLKNSGELRIHLPMDAIYNRGSGTLRDDWAEKGNREFLNLVEQSLFWKDADPGDDSDYGDTDAIGTLDLGLYRFQIEIDGHVLATHGTGSRVVRLLFTSGA